MLVDGNASVPVWDSAIRGTSGLSDAFDFELPGKIALDDSEEREVGGKEALQLFDGLQNDHGEQAVELSLHVWQVAEVQVGSGLSAFISKEVEHTDPTQGVRIFALISCG